jgi:hypothetical protein
MTNTPNGTPVHEESTYQLLIRSEEKERGLIEGIVYLLLVIATTTTIWQFSHQPMTFADIDSSAQESDAIVL